MVSIDWKSVFTKELVQEFVSAINKRKRIEHNVLRIKDVALVEC